MQIIIDISEEDYKDAKIRLTMCGSELLENTNGRFAYSIANGTPLTISEDGTLSVTVDDYTQVKRVLVQDDKHNGGLFYADSN